MKKTYKVNVTKQNFLNVEEYAMIQNNKRKKIELKIYEDKYTNKEKI